MISRLQEWAITRFVGAVESNPEVHIEERLEARRIRRTTLEIIQNEADLEKILSKFEEIGIVRERGLMIIDNGLANGSFYQNPKGIINLV